MLDIRRYISEDGSELMLNFASYDNKFIVKAISKQEQKAFLKDKISIYYERVMNESNLEHIYGIYKLIIKGNIYRLMIVENTYYGGLFRNSIFISSGMSEPNLIQEEEKFVLDESERRRFEEVLNEDIGYLRMSKMRSCKIYIEIFREKPDFHNRCYYSGVYKDCRRYLSISISNIMYAANEVRYKNLRRSSIELSVDTRNLYNIESRIRNYIE